MAADAREGKPLDGRERARYLELDSLRGVATLFIIAAHIEFAPFFWTWSLMDMFFVLSSFLLTQVVYKQCANFSGVLTFYGRRIERIWPLYLLTVWGLFVVALVKMLNHSGATEGVAVFWRYFSFSQYSELILDPLLTVAPAYPGYGLHLWSLAVEEQFYVLLPLALLWLRRWPLWLWLSALVVLAVAANVYRINAPNMYVLFSHADAFVLGSLLAIVLPRIGAHAATLRLALWLLLVVGAAGFMPYLVEGFSQYTAGLKPQGYAGWPALPSTLFWVGAIGLLAIHRGHAVLATARWPALVHLGRLSYPVYLVHFPILRLLAKPLASALEISVFSASLLCLPLIFGVAEMLYRVIDRRLQERPLTRLRPAIG